MKKTIAILAACTMLLSITGCSKDEEGIPAATTTSLIYVQEDGLDYAENEMIGGTTAVTDAEGNPIETNETLSATTNPNESGGNGDGNPTVTTKPSGSGNPTYPIIPDDEKDSEYNTILPPTIEETNMTFGNIMITLWEEKDGRKSNGLGATLALGDTYGINRDTFHEDKGFSALDKHLEIEVSSNEVSELMFAFEGAEHIVNDTHELTTPFYVELQSIDGHIAEAEDVANIGIADGYEYFLKAFATVLDEERIRTYTEDGKIKLNTFVDIEYELITPQETVYIYTGMPYNELTDILGEGVMIVDEDDNEYYVYKSEVFTLVIQHTVYKDYNNSDVLSTIILIKNDLSDDISPNETSESEDAETVLLVPNIEDNISDGYSLSEFWFEGDRVYMDRIIIENFMGDTGLQLCELGTTSLREGDFTFQSRMFGVPTDANDPSSFRGTMVSVELITSQGELVTDPEIGSDAYWVKGIHVSEFFTKDDIDIEFYKGIKVGTSKAEVEELLGGEGTRFNEYVVYKNTKNTLMFEYTFEDGEQVVDSVTLLNNFKKP